MKLTFEAFARPLFGPRYQGAVRALLVSGIVFFGLRLAGLRWSLPLPTLYLLVTAGTGGILWQSLAAEGRSPNLENPCMLPVSSRTFVFSYVAALGSHTLLTKTVPLLAALLAVSVWPPVALGGSLLCGVHGVLVTAALFVQRTWVVGELWAAAVAALLLLGGTGPGLFLGLAASSLLAGWCLWHTDGYAFYRPGEARLPRHRFSGRPSLGRYLVRYLLSHKNYLVNTGILWGMAWVLPLFFRQVAGVWMAPLGFALLSFNTPMGILLSCDPSSQQAIRFLPGQRRTFCLPYGLFLCACHLVADGFFLCSWQLQMGGVSGPMLAAAVFFALESAILAVLLEWFFPIRSWKTESDLWHHPRKYVVPGILLSLAVLVGAQPGILPVLLVGLALEAAVLLVLCLLGEPLP